MQKNFHRFLAALLIAALVWGSLPARPAYAAGFVVDSLADNNTAGDGLCTLREAIESANNAGNGDCGADSTADDTITFSVSGTITLSSTLPAIVSGQGALTVDGGGNITISGNNSVQVFYVNAGAALTLQNLTVANGRTTTDGGGVYNAGTLTVSNSTFSGNRAHYGGGIYNASTLMVNNSTVSNNGAAHGGGVYNAGTLTVSNSTVSGNSANYGGGGIDNLYGTLTVSNSTFSSNQTYENGGGINNVYGTITVSNSTFSGNAARYGNGGGIQNDGRLTVINSTFSRNSADYPGGSIHNRGTLTLHNTIIANSSYGGECVGTVSSAQNNLIEGTGNRACGLTDGVNGNIIGFDPDLGTLTGSPAYLPLNAGSLAIDAGDNALCAAAPVSNQSQNGATRPQDGNGDSSAICDIGSYEAPDTFPPYVLSTSLQPSYTSSGPSSFEVTFNEAIDDQPGLNPDDVTNPANYLLINKGANGAADTLSCLAGPAGDDSQVTVSSVSYNPATFTSTVTLAAPLGAGSYRLFVCGTTSIVDLAGNALNGATDFTFDFAVSRAALPATGFPRGQVTLLPPQTTAYADSGMTLDIPSLNLRAPIVGVPQTVSGWDTTWLGTSVGWLQGSAFPTWAGNTVLTGHVWNADNTPGIFAPIKNLRYGDRIYIHAFDQTYVYEVRENRLLSGLSGAASVFRHEDYDWVTLLTCEGYSERVDTYLFRRIVRAVLVEVR